MEKSGGRATAQRFADAPALIYGDLHWNYGELNQKTNRVAAALAMQGVHQGDRVMMTLPNCPEFVTCFLAINKLGAVVVNGLHDAISQANADPEIRAVVVTNEGNTFCAGANLEEIERQRDALADGQLATLGETLVVVGSATELCLVE